MPAPPYDLRCEYCSTPLGIDTCEPRLSWTLAPDCAGGQRAYRLRVTSNRVSCDSGWIDSDQTLQVPYSGPELRSRTRYLWSVQVRDGEGNESGFAPDTWFETGFLNDEPWDAEWIASGAGEVGASRGADYFRTSFQLALVPDRCRLYITGLGFFEAHINGRPVGNHVLTPNWTDYGTRDYSDLEYPYVDRGSKRVLYRSFDVGALVRRGENVLGVHLGNGWFHQVGRTVEGRMHYGRPRLLCRLESGPAEDPELLALSDATWRTHPGPIVDENLFLGERVDLRRRIPGWSEPGFDETGWEPVRSVDAPSGWLRSQFGTEEVIEASITPTAVREIAQRSSRTWAVDFGVNTAGWVTLDLPADFPRDGTITMRCAEEANEDGSLDLLSAGGDTQVQRVEIIAPAGEAIKYRPTFSRFAFRHLEIAGLHSAPPEGSLKLLPIHSEAPVTGAFRCSDSSLNLLQDACVRTIQANMAFGVPTDCPHRERLGYTGDGHVAAEAVLANLDASRFYAKWIDDIFDAQNRETGYVPHTAPFYGGGGGYGWGSACVLLPWQLYLRYGDTHVLAAHLDRMLLWLAYCAAHTGSPDEGLEKIVVSEEPGSWCLGDWATPDPTNITVPKELVNTYFYGRCVATVARIEEVLGRADDAHRHRELLSQIRGAFHARFYDNERSCYADGRQGANLFAWYLGAVPANLKSAVADATIRIIRRNGNRLDTGIFGTPLLLDFLAAQGEIDLALEVILSEEIPGYGYMLANGATTIWENWDGSGSHNHPMFASVSAWFYRCLAGIAPDPDAPGFGRVRITPQFPQRLDWVEAEQQTARGPIRVRWERAGGSIELRCSLAPGITGEVLLPAGTREIINNTATFRLTGYR